MFSYFFLFIILNLRDSNDLSGFFFDNIKVKSVDSDHRTPKILDPIDQSHIMERYLNFNFNRCF